MATVVFGSARQLSKLFPWYFFNRLTWTTIAYDLGPFWILSVTSGSCTQDYGAKRVPHAQSHSSAPCDRSTACAFCSLTSYSHVKVHEPNPIGRAGIGHTQSCFGQHFVAGLSKGKVHRKVDLLPEHQIKWSKGGSFVDRGAISHHQNRQVSIPILLILCHKLG